MGLVCCTAIASLYAEHKRLDIKESQLKKHPFYAEAKSRWANKTKEEVNEHLLAALTFLQKKALRADDGLVDKNRPFAKRVFKLDGIEKIINEMEAA